VEGADADLLEGLPQARISQRPQEGAARLGDQGQRYAVNHTGAASMALVGLGFAKGFCHMLPCPEKWAPMEIESCNIDSRCSHAT